MDWFWSVLDLLVAPFRHFLSPGDRMSYVYLTASLFIAVSYYLITEARKGTLKPAGLVRWLLPKEILSHPSAQVDFAFFYVNRVLQAALYGSVIVFSPAVAAGTKSLLTAAFGPPAAGYQPSVGITILTTLILVLVLDFTMWLAHYIYHKVPFLWDYHKVHHSAEVMTPITAGRMHPIEELSDSALAAITLGSTYAALGYFLGDAAKELTIYEINIVIALFFYAAFHLRHSHVWIRYPYWLQHIFVCPAQHQIHHSVDKKHWDKNMGFIFAFWDWAAGTLYAPKEREEITFGLGTEEDGGTWHSLKALYFLPFKQSWEKLRPKKDVPQEPAE